MKKGFELLVRANETGLKPKSASSQTNPLIMENSLQCLYEQLFRENRKINAGSLPEELSNKG